MPPLMPILKAVLAQKAIARLVDAAVAALKRRVRKAQTPVLVREEDGGGVLHRNQRMRDPLLKKKEAQEELPPWGPLPKNPKK